jgi:hypothetical protein
VIAYAGTTGTLRNIAALRAAGWRLFLTPAKRAHHGLRYAIDNGAWGAYCRREPWESAGFLRLVTALGADADFVVLPDVVGDGPRSLAVSLAWLPELRPLAPRFLLPVQDGVDPDAVRAQIGPTVGIFVGGTTVWKLATLPLWAAVARVAGCYLHVARVNTVRRIRRCQCAGADSFDGTSVTRYAINLPRLDTALRQGSLWGR